MEVVDVKGYANHNGNKRAEKANRGDQVSLAMQFVASFFWAIGAALSGPSGAADFLQLFAAVAWCVANFASAWSMCGKGKATPATKSSVELSTV